MSNANHIPLFRVSMSPDAKTRVSEVLESGYIGEGIRCEAFEFALQSYIDHPHLRVVNSGTSALILAYKLAGIGHGKRVISTPLTCLAGTQALLHTGTEIVWADVDPETAMLDPEAVEKILKREPIHSIVSCDWGGSTIANTDLRRLAAQYGCEFIEDAAHAFGSMDEDGKPVGHLSDFTCFSFQGIKTLTTCDGGAIATKHAHHAEEVRLLRWFGLDRKRGESMRCYQQVPFAGYKFQLNDCLAAIGLANLLKVREWISARRHNALLYGIHFGGTAVRAIRQSPGSASWLYSIRVPHAQAFMEDMRNHGIEVSQVHARNDVQRIFHRSRRHLPGMDTLEKELVCLPCGPWVTDEQVEAIAEATKTSVMGKQAA